MLPDQVEERAETKIKIVMKIEITKVTDWERVVDAARFGGVI